MSLHLVLKKTLIIEVAIGRLQNVDAGLCQQSHSNSDLYEGCQRFEHIICRLHKMSLMDCVGG